MSKGYKSLEELINNSDLQPDQKYIIEHIDELDEKIPRWEMDLLQEYIFRTLKQFDNRYLIEACGSFRRGAKFSESLNIVISHPEFKEDANESIDDFLKKFINDLKIKGFCTEYFPKGSSKYLVRIFKNIFFKKKQVINSYISVGGLPNSSAKCKSKTTFTS